MSSVMRSAASVAGIALATVFVTTPALANRSAEIRACAADSERGQIARKEGKLVDAHAKLLACAKATCPAAIRVDCERWAREVGESMPTMVVIVRDSAGADLPDAVITIDGKEVSEATRGRAFEVDPGPHVVRAVRGDAPPVEQNFIIHEGERLRSVQLVITSHDAVAREPPKVVPPPRKNDDVLAWAKTPVVGWVLLGVGVAALGTGSFFAIRQKVDYDDLESTCAPRCDPAEAKAIDDARVVAAVSGGIGLIAAAAGTWILLTTKPSQGAAQRIGVGVAGTSLTFALRY